MRNQLSAKDKYILMNGLSTTLNSGLSLLDSVNQISKTARGTLKKFCETLSEDISEGLQISDTIEKYQNSFDPITITLIREGEASGTLSEILQDISDDIKSQIDIQSRLKSSLVYPIFILLLFVVILTIIFMFVIPRIAKVLSRLRMELPLPTKIIIYISEILNTYGIYIIIGIFIIGIFFWILYLEFHSKVISWISRLPFFNSLTLDIDLNRFSRSFYLLLNSGISLEKSFKYISTALSRGDVKSAVNDISEMVLNGDSISSGIKKHNKVFPDIMLGVIEAGERSGELKESMQKLTNIFSSQIDTKLKTLTTLVEPIILVTVGVLVGGVMLSIIAPIYQLIANISPK